MFRDRDGNFDEEQFNAFCDRPFKGSVHGYLYADGKMFINVYYDDFFCYNDHANAIVSYDIETGEQKELWYYESLEIFEDIEDFIYHDGSLYGIHCTAKYDENHNKDEETIKHELCRITENGLETVLDSDKFPQNMTFYVPYYTDESIIFAGCENKKEPGSRIFKFFEYSDEDGTLREVGDMVSTYFTPALKFGDDIIHMEKDEDDSGIIVGENIRINTGIRGLDLCAVSGNKITAIVSDQYKCELYTYDLDKMELCVSNVTGKADRGSVYSTGNYLMLDSGRTVFCLIPELGALFRTINTDYSGNFGKSGDQFWLIDAERGYSLSSDDTEPYGSEMNKIWLIREKKGE